VQYFSVTHKCWLNAWAHFTAHPDEFGIKHIGYNIQVARQSTVRKDVPLDMLRLPLALEEKVEVFVKREDGGLWVPGTVAGQKSNGKTSPDYTIKLLDNTLDRFPAIQVRRYFAPGDAVEVYRGSDRGWVLAKVQQRQDDAEYPEALSKNSPQPPTCPPTNVAQANSGASGSRSRATTGHSENSEAPRARATTGTSSTFNDTPATHGSEAFHPWVNMLIAEDSQFGTPAKEEVPIWLLRQPDIAESGSDEDVGTASRFLTRTLGLRRDWTRRA